MVTLELRVLDYGVDATAFPLRMHEDSRRVGVVTLGHAPSTGHLLTHKGAHYRVEAVDWNLDSPGEVDDIVLYMSKVGA